MPWLDQDFFPAEAARLDRKQQVLYAPRRVIKINVFDPPARLRIRGSHAELLQLSDGSQHNRLTPERRVLFNSNPARPQQNFPLQAAVSTHLYRLLWMH